MNGFNGDINDSSQLFPNSIPSRTVRIVTYGVACSKGATDLCKVRVVGSIPTLSTDHTLT